MSYHLEVASHEHSLSPAGNNFSEESRVTVPAVCNQNLRENKMPNLYKPGQGYFCVACNTVIYKQMFWLISLNLSLFKITQTYFMTTAV